MASKLVLDAVSGAAKAISVHEDANDVKAASEKNQHKFNVTGFFSPYENAGVTTLIINTAIILAGNKNSVCVVDLNLAKPDVYRYLTKDAPGASRSTIISIHNKLVNSSLPIAEFVNLSKYKGISYVTASFEEHPADFCPSDDSESQSKRMMDMFSDMFAELAATYDFVLIDMAPDVTDVSTVSTFLSADNVFTITDGTIKSVENIFKDKNIFDSIDMSGIFNNIIQNKLRSVYWSGKDFSKISQDCRLIMNIPFSDSVSELSMNLSPFIGGNKSIASEDIRIKSCLEYLAQIIVQFAKDGVVGSLNGRFTSKEDAALIAEARARKRRYEESVPLIDEGDFSIIEMPAVEMDQERLDEIVEEIQNNIDDELLKDELNLEGSLEKELGETHKIVSDEGLHIDDELDYLLNGEDDIDDDYEIPDLTENFDPIIPDQKKFMVPEMNVTNGVVISNVAETKKLNLSDDLYDGGDEDAD